jgi:hypothetical protein
MLLVSSNDTETTRDSSFFGMSRRGEVIEVAIEEVSIDGEGETNAAMPHDHLNRLRSTSSNHARRGGVAEDVKTDQGEAERLQRRLPHSPMEVPIAEPGALSQRSHEDPHLLMRLRRTFEPAPFKMPTQDDAAQRHVQYLRCSGTRVFGLPGEMSPSDR